MVSLLFTIGSTVVNALAFSGTNFLFSRFMDHGEKERKKHDLELEMPQRARGEWNKARMKRLDFINKSLREKNEARVYINNIDRAMLEYPSPNYQIFITHQNLKKMVNYCLLQWAEVLEHMPYTNTSNK